MNREEILDRLENDEFERDWNLPDGEEFREDVRRIVEDSGWILCSERMPKEHDSIFAKLKGTDKCGKAMYEKRSKEVIVTFEYEKGGRGVMASHTLDGSWRCEKDVIKRKVIAWQPLPEAYGKEETEDE